MLYVLLIFYKFLEISAEIQGIEASHNHGINVVLFFADSTNPPSDHSGLDCVGLHQVANVQFAKPMNIESRSTIHRRNLPDCEGFLKTALDSLVHFCQNALGMKTAVLSVKSQEIINEITNEPQEIKNPSLIETRHIKQKYQYSDSNHRIVHNIADNSIPSYLKNANKDIITSPEHTELFKIRVRRGTAETEKPKEILNIPLERDGRQPWDVLDIMSHVRYSFFGKLFEKENENQLTKENKEILNEIGRTKQDPGLFETVKSTLATLQDTSEPFLMVVFGGHLSEIRDQQSPLIQTIKYIIETTNPEKTIVVLTGTCPESSENLIIIKENIDFKNPTTPVFAKGPHNDKLSHCNVLYDIPLIIRNLLEESSPNYRDIMRPKRHLDSLMHIRESGSGKSTKSKISLIIFLYVIVNFLL